VVSVVVGAVDVVVFVVGALVVVVELVVCVVVVELLVGVVVVDDVGGTVVVVVPSPSPPASAITAITRPITSAATRPIATFWPVLIPPSSS
jgi:hypothetical protein